MQATAFATGSAALAPCAPCRAAFTAAAAATAAAPLAPVALPRWPQRAQRLQLVAARKGFSGGGSSSSSGTSIGGGKKQPKLARYLEVDVEEEVRGRDLTPEEGWIELTGVDPETSFVSKPIKAFIMKNGRGICLYKVGDRLFCSDVQSTAYKFPLIDATLKNTKEGPAVEVPLDGTTYDLATGKVLSWCPKDNLLRSVLGALKDRSNPVDLPVYPLQVRGSTVYVKLTDA